MNSEITVIIPVYNVEKYLERCILSVINQTFKNLEIIIINDGSTDKSSAICEKYKKKDKRIIYINRENKGCSYTRNQGIDMSRSKYISFVDSDDFLELNMYQKLYNSIQKKKGDLCICGFKSISKNKIDFRNIEKDFLKKEDFYFKNAMYISIWNKLYKSSIIKSNKVYFPKNIKISEDIAFNFKYFMYMKKIVAVKENLYNYFRREDSITKNYKNHLDGFEVLDYINELIEVQKKDILFEKIKNEIFLHILCRTNYLVLEQLKFNNQLFFEEFQKKMLEYESKYRKDMFLSTKFKIFYRKIRLNFIFLRPLYRKIKNI